MNQVAYPSRACLMIYLSWYTWSIKSMDYADFKAKYEADAVELVKSKQSN
jgi:hypothetical protein